MEAKKYVMVKNNEVINAVIWNGDNASWQPPHDVLMIQNDDAGIGDWWEEAEQRFYRPLPVPVVPSEEQSEQEEAQVESN